MMAPQGLVPGEIGPETGNNSSEIISYYPNDGLTMLAGRRYVILKQILVPRSLAVRPDGQNESKQTVKHERT